MKQTFVLGIVAGLILAAGITFLALRDSTSAVADDSAPPQDPFDEPNPNTPGTAAISDSEAGPIALTDNDPFDSEKSATFDLNETTLASSEPVATSLDPFPDSATQPPNGTGNSEPNLPLDPIEPTASQSTVPKPYYLTDDVQYFAPGPTALFPPRKPGDLFAPPTARTDGDERSRMAREFVELAAKQASLMTADELKDAIRTVRATTSELTAQRELEQAQFILSRILELHPESSAATVVREMLKETSDTDSKELVDEPDSAESSGPDANATDDSTAALPPEPELPTVEKDPLKFTFDLVR